jgi:hypothetical protein
MSTHTLCFFEVATLVRIEPGYLPARRAQENGRIDAGLTESGKFGILKLAFQKIICRFKPFFR